MYLLLEVTLVMEFLIMMAAKQPLSTLTYALPGVLRTFQVKCSNLSLSQGLSSVKHLPLIPDVTLLANDLSLDASLMQS
jgi:hypothetical protein